MSWKVGDLCVAKSSKFDWINSEVKQLDEDVAHVESLEYGDVEQIDISELKPFGPSVVNREGKLIECDGFLGYYGGWKVGDACVAQWTQDGAWYNSQILHFFNEDEILVRFVDYGNADFTTLGNLKPAGSPLGNLPCQSPKASVSPSKPESKAEALSPISMKRVSFAVEESLLEEKKPKCWSVGDKCVARWSEDGVWYKSQILAIKGEQVTVEFTDYGNEGVTTLEQLKPAYALDKSEDSRTLWKVGDLCVAMWNEDNVWYNSQIIEIDGDRVLVKFIEYGNEDYTNLSKLKPSGSLDQTMMEVKEDKWKVGDLCVAQWNEDQVWYNSEIVEMDGEKVLVRFVEYGNEGYTTLDQLKLAGSLDNAAEGNSIQIDKEKTWAVGDLCVAQWEEDQVWYNSRIMEIHGDKVLVQFVDYGNEDFASLSQLKPAGSLESEGSTPQLENRHENKTLEDLHWKVKDFCVAKSAKFDQMYNSQIMKINEDKAVVYFIEFSKEEELPFSALLPFGPYAVNKEEKLVEFKDSEDVCVESIDGWKDGDECVAKWVQDNTWYNSKILKIFSETEVLVQFTEFGNADFTNISDLKPLGRSSEVSLVADKENTSETTSYRSKYDGKEVSTINKQGGGSDTEKNVECVSSVQKRNETTNMPLKDNNYAEEEQAPSKFIGDTQKLDVKISQQKQKSMNDNKQETEAKIETSESKLKTRVSRSAPNRECKGVGKRWKLGDLCVAKWREDGVWYNSKIVGIENNKVHVLFVDFGNRDYAVLEELKPPGSLHTNGTLKKVDSGQFSDLEETDDDRTTGWKVGDVCKAPLNVDQSWLDCKILDINFDQVLVEFIEHGSQHYCSVHSLRPLPLGNGADQGKKANIEKVNTVDSRNISEKGDFEFIVDDVLLDTSANTKEKAEAVKLEKIESTKPNKPLPTPLIKPDSPKPSNNMEVETSRPKDKLRSATATARDIVAVDCIPAKNTTTPVARDIVAVDCIPAKTTTTPLARDIVAVDCIQAKNTNTPLARDIVAVDCITAKNTNTPLVECSQANWKVGDKAAAFWESDGRWRHAIIQELDGDEAFVICPDESMVKGTSVNISELKHKSVPTDGLNLVDDEIKDIKRSQINLGKEETNKTKGSYENNKKDDINPDYSQEMDMNTSVTSQSSPESSANNGDLLTFSDLTKQSPKTDPKCPQAEIVKPILSGNKGGSPVGDYSGKMLNLAMTESGSRYLQSVIPGMAQQEIQNLQTELMVNPVSVMNHPKATFVVQKLMEVADERSMEIFVDSVTKHFSWLACHPAGCRVVQKCAVMSSPAQQTKIFTQLQDQRSLVMLSKNKYGTRVVQTCLPLMPVKTLKLLVDSLLGHMVDLGRHPQATYFIQQLVVLETGHQVGTHFLIEEIFQNLDLLAYDKFGTWLVQALISPISPSPVLQRLSSWTVANLSSIYVSQPAVFLAVAVFQRLVVLASNSPSENWSSLLVKFVGSLTGVEVEGRPLLITAAIHSVGHLLSREIVLQMANIVDAPTKNQVLSVLAKYTIVLKADSFGCIVLKALHGLV